MARRKTTPSSTSLTRLASHPGQAEQLLSAGFGSAFAIARDSIDNLMKRAPGLTGDEARNLHQRATALAVLAARHYREQRLTAQEAATRPWRTGLRALVDGPTFESQFSPSWADNCPPGSIEATTSPAAYLTALFRWATRVIEPLADVDEGQPIFLAVRRPDLAGLVLDNPSLERVEPTLGIVNEILESAARKHLDDHNEKGRSVDDALLEARYPFGLPFERYMSQINAVLGRKDGNLGELVRQLDPQYPYFCRGGLHSQRSDDALQMDTALGPEQRALLLEAPYFPRGARRASARSVQTRTNPRTLQREPLHALQASFFMRHYGVGDVKDLVRLETFCLRTGLDQDGLESLLSIQRYAPLASPNVPGLAPATPARFGSVYINAALEPVIGVDSSEDGHQLHDWTNDHFDRMQRMTRLAGWLDLSFGDTDRLLDAALQAEHGEAGRGREISENTLRALGLFRRLHRDFQVTAEDFAALLQGVGVYARGSDLSQFDRVFNDPALFSEPLVLDDSPFNIIPGTEAEFGRINHLCAALGIDFDTYLYLARYIAQGWSQEAILSGGQSEILYWSHGVVSAFYRLARLPVWLGLSSIEVLALLQLVGERSHEYVSRLVRTNLAIHQHSDLSDTLSVVQSLVDTVQWCRSNELSVAWLYQHLMPLAPVAAVSDRELNLLRQINGRMLPTLLDQAAFLAAGLPVMSGSVDEPEPIDWSRELEQFLDVDGLVLEPADHVDTDSYEEVLRLRLEVLVDDLELADGPHLVVRLFQMVMDARSAQRSLAWESLASTFGGSAELCEEVLAWAGGNSYQLLAEVLRVFGGATEPLPIPIGDEVLALFARLGHRMGIATQLSLSALAVRTWRLHPGWFEGEAGQESGEITFARLHLLTQYRHLLEFTDQAEQAILEYLKLVNSLPPDLSDADLRLIREDAAGKIALFTGFSIRDVLETALEITVQGIIANVRQLDHLVRVRQTCATLQLGTSAALELSRLRSNSPREAWRTAAESALASLTQQLAGEVPAARGELGQSEASWIVVDTQRLVAQAGGKARCLLTVKNFLGQPLPGITVAWQTSLSKLDAPSSGSTDENGQVDINLLAGDEMGTAQVMARFGLDRRILAPLILIDCDDTTLKFTNPFCEPMQALAGNLETIEYRLQVIDDFGNPGRDRVLQWSTDLGTFERPQTRTDAEGFASARLRSLSSGEANVVVDLPVNGEQDSFEPVTFLEQPYFQYVRFTGPVAATQITGAVCRVVNLDGSPEPGVKVQWAADLGGFEAEPAESVTDAEGIARIDYLSAEAGDVTLTVGASHEGQELQALSSVRTPVHDLPRMVEREPEEQYFVIDQFHPARFQVRLEPAAAGYPVYWYLGEELLATTSTSPDGTGGFTYYFKPQQMGDQVITVRSLRENESLDFKVTVVSPHTGLIPQKGPESPGLVPINPAEGKFAFDPGTSSKLLIRALRSDGSGDSDCRLTFSQSNGLDPATLGVVFSPAFGEAISCNEDGEAILQVDCTKAAFLPNSDPYANEFAITVTSNLGVTLELRLRLRYLLDLAKSQLHFFRQSSTYMDLAALSGQLHRRNGHEPLSLRSSARTLRLVLEGATNDSEDVLLTYEQGGLWLHAGIFGGKPGELGSSCRFEPVGDLGKRIQFAGSSVYEAKTVITGGDLTVTASADPGLLEEGTGYFADHGGTYHFELLLRGDDGPLAGVPLVPETFVSNGAQYRSSGPTDSAGKITIELETSTAVLGKHHDLSLTLGHLSTFLDLRTREFVNTEADLTLTGGAVRAVMRFTRREGRTFTDMGAWSGSVRAVDGGVATWVAPHDPQQATSSSTLVSTPIPGTLRISLLHPSSGWRLLLNSEFPITDALIEGDES